MKNNILFALLVLFFFSSPIFAQQVTLSIDPPIVSAKIKPGKSILIAYTVKNSGDPTNLQFILRPFVPVGQQGSLSLVPQMEGPVQFNLENADVTLEKPFFFPSNEKRQAVVRISVPSGIPDGDYYYMMLAETVPAFSLGGQSTGVASASIGSPILVSVTESGITQVQAQIAEFSFSPYTDVKIGNKTYHIVDSSESVSIVSSVRNMGVHLIQPHGTLTHHSGAQNTTYSIIPQNVLSNSQRILKVEGVSMPDTTLVLSGLALGRHSVSEAVTFGDDSSIHYKDVSFIVLPVGLLKSALAAIVLVILYFGYRIASKKKKHNRAER